MGGRHDIPELGVAAAADPALEWRRWARVLAAGVPGCAYVELLGVAVRSATDAWAVGEAQPTGSLALRPVIEHWNGHRWRLMANPKVPPQTALTGVTVAPDGEAWAVGAPFTNSRRGVVLHWTGRSWVTAAKLATSTSVLLDHVALVGKTVWAVGTASDANGRFGPYVLRWDGRRWAMAGLLAVAGGQFESVTAVGRGRLIAVGEGSKGALPVERPTLGGRHRFPDHAAQFGLVRRGPVDLGGGLCLHIPGDVPPSGGGDRCLVAPHSHVREPNENLSGRSHPSSG